LWRGELKGVSMRGARLGDVAFRTEALHVLTGRFAAEIEARDGALTGKGHLSLGPGGVSIRHAKFVFDLAAANRYAILGSPLSGAVRTEIEHLAWSRKGCFRGGGKLWTDVLVAPAKRFQTKAFDLAGEGACVDGDLVVALSGKGEEGAVSLSLKVSSDFTYVMTAEAQPARTEVAEALQIIGFQRSNGVLTIGTTGAITTLGS
jgi:hypothetical protein